MNHFIQICSGISLIFLISCNNNLKEETSCCTISLKNEWTGVTNGKWDNDSSKCISVNKNANKEITVEIEGRKETSFAAASETILLNQKTPAPITASGWIKRGSDFNTPGTLVAFDLLINYQDNTHLWWVNSRTNPNDAGKWIFKKETLTPSKPVKSIKFLCLNYKTDAPSQFKDMKIETLPDCSSREISGTGNRIELANKMISLCFLEKNTLVKLNSLKKSGEDYDLIDHSVSDENIWQVSFRDKQNSNTLNISGGGEFSYIKKNDYLTLSWKNIDVQDEKAVFDVIATIKLDKAKTLSDWHIKTVSRTRKSTLSDICFPLISGIASPGPQEKSYLFYPQDIGRLSKLKELEQKSLKYGSWYMTMQFIHLYGEKGGFYLAAKDGKGFLKEFSIARDYPSKEHFTAFVKQTPSEADVSNYESPYDVTLGIVNGDWYDAAILYRDWALGQKWCLKGPLHKRKDFPGPLKEIALWVMNLNGFAKFYQGADKFINKRHKEGMERYSYSSSDFLYKNLFEYDPDKIVKEFIELKKYLGQPIASWSHPYLEPFGVGIPRYLVPKGLPEAMKKLRSENIYFVPWTSARLFDIQIEKWKKDKAVNSAVIDESGNTVYTPCNVKCAAMCMATNYWQNEVVNFTGRLMDMGFTGIYYDELASTGAEMCFSKKHAHCAGGGNYALNARRNILNILHEKFLKQYPYYFSSGEELSEYLLDANDSNFLYGSRFTDSVPAFQVVYHDYAYCYGRLPGKFYDPYLIKFYVDKSGNSNIDELATTICRNFVYGINIGCTRRDIVQFSPEAAEFIKELLSFFSIGKKYLIYGQMLKAPKIKNNTPFAANWIQENQKRNDFPTIFSSAWKAPDGKIGIVLANASSFQQAPDIEINLKDYGMETQTYIATDIKTQRIISSSENKIFAERIPIKGHGARIIEFSPAINPALAEAQELPPFTVCIAQNLSEARKNTEGKIRVTIENLNNSDLKGDITISTDSKWEIIPSRKLSVQIPRGRKSYIFMVKLPENAESINQCKVNIFLDNGINKKEFSETFYIGLKDAMGKRKNVKQYSVTKLTKDIQINANLSDWPENIPVIDKLDAKNMKLRKDEIKVQARAAWTEKGLYMSFIVDSEHHVSPAKGENVWKGDCIQLAFNIFMPDCDRYSLKNICLFMTTDGKPGVYCFEQNYISNNIKLAVSRNENRVIYEVFIPKFILVTLKENHQIPFSFTLNKNDGKGFRGWLEWTPGVCGGANPEMFGDLKF